MKSNFKKALTELTGFGEEDAAVEAAFVALEEEPQLDTKYEVNTAVAISIPSDGTKITENMVITGEIKSSDNIFIQGRVFGNITTEANVSMEGAHVSCNFNIEGDLSIGQNTVAVGDITCENARVNGKLKGNLDARGSVCLSHKAYVLGDIFTDGIVTETGAQINGRISPKTDKIDLDEEFNLGGEF